jgi:hypothetical protein
VCIPLADAFQRLLTAHRKPGLCVVCLPAISAFQRHNTQQHSILHYYGLQLKKFRPAKTARIAGENGRADRQNGRTIFIAN